MILLLSSLAWGIKNIAVLDFETVSGPKKCARFAEETVRTAISRDLDRDKFNLFTKENLLAMIKTEVLSKTCSESSCQLEVAKNIGAHYAITGSFYRISNIEYLSISLYETREGTLLEKQTIKANTCNNLFEKIDLSKIKSNYFSGQTLQQKYEEAANQAYFYKTGYNRVLKENYSYKTGYNRVLKENESLYEKLRAKKTKVGHYPVYKYRTQYITKKSADDVLDDVAGSLIVATLTALVVYEHSHNFDSNPNSITHYQFGKNSYHSSDMARAWRWGSAGAFFGSFGLSYTILRQF